MRRCSAPVIPGPRLLRGGGFLCRFRQRPEESPEKTHAPAACAEGRRAFPGMAMPRACGAENAFCRRRKARGSSSAYCGTGNGRRHALLRPQEEFSGHKRAPPSPEHETRQKTRLSAAELSAARAAGQRCFRTLPSAPSAVGKKPPAASRASVLKRAGRPQYADGLFHKRHRAQFT